MLAGMQGSQRGTISGFLFDTIDSNHDGMIDRDEFRTALKGHVINPAPESGNAMNAKPLA